MVSDTWGRNRKFLSRLITTDIYRYINVSSCQPYRFDIMHQEERPDGIKVPGCPEAGSRKKVFLISRLNKPVYHGKRTILCLSAKEKI